MIGVGNDIVSLSLTDARRTRLPQFYNKILNAAEIELYQGCTLPFEQYVWLLWSIKEAVYKCAKRHNTLLLFSPKKIAVQNIAEAQSGAVFTCTATCNGVTYYGKSYVYDEVIHSVVTNQTPFHLDDLHWGLQFIDDDCSGNQSAQVRELAKDAVSNMFGAGSISFTKADAGYPQLVINNSVSKLPLSFSHHGNYVAYAYICNVTL